ncbi:hypothetical protein, partial [Halanaerobium congolense]
DKSIIQEMVLRWYTFRLAEHYFWYTFSLAYADYIIDGQMTAEIGGAGIYFRNMRNAAKKKREENQ